MDEWTIGRMIKWNNEQLQGWTNEMIQKGMSKKKKQWRNLVLNLEDSLKGSFAEDGCGEVRTADATKWEHVFQNEDMTQWTCEWVIGRMNKGITLWLFNIAMENHHF